MAAPAPEKPATRRRVPGWLETILLLGLALGVTLGYLERLAWLVMGSLVAFFSLVLTKLRPGLSWLDPTRLGVPVFRGEAWTLDLPVLAFHLGLACALLAVALRRESARAVVRVRRTTARATTGGRAQRTSSSSSE